jgi:hypothetical protein
MLILSVLESFLSFATPIGREWDACYFVPELCHVGIICVCLPELWKCAVDSSRENDYFLFSERIVSSCE